MFFYNDMEQILDNLLYQPYHWKRFNCAFKSWSFRMTVLTDDDLKNKVPPNNLGIYSLYCDKGNWTRGDGIESFWYVINDGYYDMMYDYWESLND